MGVGVLPPRDVEVPAGCRCTSSSSASSAGGRLHAPAGMGCNYRGFPGVWVEFEM